MANNGKKPTTPPESLHFERQPVKCQRCRREFSHFMIEVIDNLVQLRCGDVLIPKIEMVCLHCGWCFYWNLREKDLEKMAAAYGELAKKVPYVPE